ncbi:hypothetical protein RMCBS344292_00562 [Rhizopus microsporus]|nr:hypothetical protein RMCBS344292_00562 [Rhizopus microsporus]
MLTKREFKAKYKPIKKINLPKWQFKPSIQRIIRRQVSATGKVSYDVQFQNKQTAIIPARHLQDLYHDMIEEYELNAFRREEKREENIRQEKRRSRRLVQRYESSGDEYTSDDSNDDNEEPATSTTRSGRIQIAPKTYDKEFYAILNHKKESNEKFYHVPLYSDDFIDQHADICFRCRKPGYPNGPKSDTVEISTGPERARTRLLMCNTCSLSCHNNCLPTKPKLALNVVTGAYSCTKCRSKKDYCMICEKVADKNNDQVLLRCGSCYRVHHPTCADKNVFQDGICIDCVTYSSRQAHMILAQRTNDKNHKEMLVKWKNTSFNHLDWVPATWLQSLHTILHNNFRKKHGTADTRLKNGRYFPQEWTMVERILNVEWEDKANQKPKRIFAVFKDMDYEEAMWDEPPSEDMPELYTPYKEALERYINASKVRPPQKMRQLIADIRKLANAEKYESHEIKTQPKYINGGTLMPHQLEALKKYNIYPFIIVVPNSTATNWIREFRKWAPELVVVPFFGLGASRRLALDNEIFDKNMNLKCHAIVATYESIQESSKLQNIFWPVMVVDESQRLKNDESQLFRSLCRFNKDHSVLLTGTPLQNNLKELFNIMNFIRPDEFEGTQAENYEELTREQVEELHGRLRPYFLRRTKEEILKTLPPKYEIIVPLSMTPLQKEVYKSCLSRDIESILGTNAYKRSKGLASIFMNLRKVLNHPYLIDGVETPQSTPEDTQKAMIDACEKLKFFHQMLPKLRSQGHRVLVFSTMTRVLDVIDDYLTHEGIPFARLDGSDSERERVRSIDAFNAPNSNLDVFLLSTRAGGVGINLATADTVIIWDSDFNPYADLQAISRAHRIGQRNMVLIYRFMTRLSVEERILQIGKKKMALEHVVVEKMKAVEDDIEDIESILKFGAQALFESDDSTNITYDSAAIDKLLDRNQYKAAAEAQKEREIAESEKRKNFSFSFAKVWKAEGGTEDLQEEPDDDAARADFWEKFLQNKQEEIERKKAEKKLLAQNLGRGARKRTKVSYNEKNLNDAAIKKSKKVKKNDKGMESDTEYLFSDREDEDITELMETETLGGLVVSDAAPPEEPVKLKKPRKSRAKKRQPNTEPEPEPQLEIVDENEYTKMLVMRQQLEHDRREQRMREEQIRMERIRQENIRQEQIRVQRFLQILSLQPAPGTSPRVDVNYAVRLSEVVQSYFVKHSEVVQSYLVTCGQQKIPKLVYDTSVNASLTQLGSTIYKEFETAISMEIEEWKKVGVEKNVLDSYVHAKRVTFKSAFEAAMTQFHQWKSHNEPLLIIMGSSHGDLEKIYKEQGTHALQQALSREVNKAITGANTNRHSQPVSVPQTSSPAVPRSISQPVSQPVSQPIPQASSQKFSTVVSQFLSQATPQFLSQIVSAAVNRQVTQSIPHPTSQPISPVKLQSSSQPQRHQAASVGAQTLAEAFPQIFANAKATSRSIAQPASRSISQSASRPIFRVATQPVSQPVSQPASQIAPFHVSDPVAKEKETNSVVNPIVIDEVTDDENYHTQSKTATSSETSTSPQSMANKIKLVKF